MCAEVLCSPSIKRCAYLTILGNDVFTRQIRMSTHLLRATSTVRPVNRCILSWSITFFGFPQILMLCGRDPEYVVNIHSPPGVRSAQELRSLLENTVVCCSFFRRYREVKQETQRWTISSTEFVHRHETRSVIILAPETSAFGKFIPQVTLLSNYRQRLSTLFTARCPHLMAWTWFRKCSRSPHIPLQTGHVRTQCYCICPLGMSDSWMTIVNYKYTELG